MKTSIVHREYFNTKGFENLSSWEQLVNALVTLKGRCRRRWIQIHGQNQQGVASEATEMKSCALKLIIHSVQCEVFTEEIEST